MRRMRAWILVVVAIALAVTAHYSTQKWFPSLGARQTSDLAKAPATGSETAATQDQKDDSKAVDTFAAIESTPIGTSVDSKGQCGTLEYPGRGPSMPKLAQESWAVTLAQFHAVKADLLQWLQKNRAGFPEKTVSVMQAQLKNLKIIRPPMADEPDLAWRGIATLGKDSEGAPMIKVGGGFVRLVEKEPARAKFELARLAAQTWAPCELKRLEVVEAWNPLLKCLGVSDANACEPGSTSEAGWAVSSAVAAVVAPPGCTLPAFAGPESSGCLNKIPLPLKVASQTQPTLWAEANP